jgi:DNA repair protein RecN (Recombination protein N)
MLTELVIRDLALIEHASLVFGPGLNAITGETGAGKSLLVGALELLRGERPRPGIVRSGARRSVVEGRFLVPRGAATEPLERWLRNHLPQVLDDWEAEGAAEERELILGRSVGADGRTKAYVDQRPVTRKVLAELAPRLFEIHGQNDHQKLLDASEQLILLDHAGRLGKKVDAYRRARARWLSKVEEALRLKEEQQERRDRLDLVRFQHGEIRAAAPDPQERSALTPERELLRSAEGLKGDLAALVDGLVEADDALLDRLRRAERTVSRWRESVSALSAPAAELEAACAHLEEAARTLRSLVDELEVDPDRLEAVEGRLAELERLERKYERDAAGLLALAEALEAEIERLEGEEQSLAEIGREVGAARTQLIERGGELRRGRKAVRPRLVRAVHKALEQLGLPKAEFDLRLGQRSGEIERSHAGLDGLDRAALESDRKLFSERGMDRIEFLLSANPGEPLQKLRHVASGGETARIMLALRSVLARSGAGRDRTLVFDEIDAGVGGRLGPAVGAHLGRLGTVHQVLCVTHLPAIAAVADRHLRVTKLVHEGRTMTRVEELSGEARVEEVADMIAGGGDQDTARAEARRLLAARSR